MGTDLRDDEVVSGNSVSILLNSKSETLIRRYYERLLRDGIKTHPLEKTQIGDIFGGLTDKYGHHWLFYCRK